MLIKILKDVNKNGLKDGQKKIWESKKEKSMHKDTKYKET